MTEGGENGCPSPHRSVVLKRRSRWKNSGAIQKRDIISKDKEARILPREVGDPQRHGELIEYRESNRELSR